MRGYSNSSIIISKLYVQCPNCEILLPSALIDPFYEICDSCSTKIIAEKAEHQMIVR